jgi:hypothetical protein
MTSFLKVQNDETFQPLPIEESPSSFGQETHDRQRIDSVRMLTYDDDTAAKAIPCSGALLQISGHKIILTAGHFYKHSGDNILNA